MARTRLIYPEAPVDDDVVVMSLAARFVWAYLPCHADREGRLADKPLALKAAILPGDAVDMVAILDELQKANLIVRYVADGKRCIQIRNFLGFQKPHPREAASELPTPAQGQPRTSLGLPKASLEVAKDAPRLPVSDPDPVSESSHPPGAHASDPSAPEPAAVVPIGGHALTTLFGRIRCEVTGAGFEWQGTPTSPEKAANMAAALEAQGLWLEAEPTIREFWRKAKAGLWPKSAEIVRSPSFAFGCWCSAFPELLESRRGQAPKAPADPGAPRCWFHQKPGTNGKKANKPDKSCVECRHVEAGTSRREGEPAPPAPPSFKPPPEWTAEQKAEYELLRKGAEPPARAAVGGGT